MNSGRNFESFIDAYLQYTKDTEPPESYHRWVALGVIAAALQRRVHLKWGHESIFPNMYIVLVGPSGRCRKGTALNIGKDLLKDVGSINTASESITREALIRKMQDAVTSYTDPETRVIRFHCALTAISPELSVFLGQNNIAFLADLTDWYDSHEEWVYETKGSGTDRIQGLCFNLIGATAPDWFSSILPNEAIGGGFTSRIIFVVEEEKGQTVPEPIFTEEHSTQRRALLMDLEQIATITGQYKMTTDARRCYRGWYEEQEELIGQGKMPVPDPRFAGYCERRATHIRKLSMLVAASHRDALTVEESDVHEAVGMLVGLEEKMPRAFAGVGSSPLIIVTEKILHYIMSMGQTTRSDVLRKFYRDIDTQGMKAVEELMEQMKYVQVIHDLEKREVIYRRLM